jgi:hypothetical protein
MRNKIFIFGVLVMAFGSCGNVGKVLNNPFGIQKSTYQIFADGAKEILAGKPFQGIMGISDLNEFQEAFEEMFPEVKVTEWTPSDLKVYINFVYQNKSYTITTTTEGKTASGEYILNWAGLGSISYSDIPSHLTDGAREILRSGNMNESAFKVAFEQKFPEAKINSSLSVPPGFSSSIINPKTNRISSYTNLHFTYKNLPWILCFEKTKANTASDTDFRLNSYVTGRGPNTDNIPPPEKIDRVK